jgi:peptidoglycan hydrolase CwlO-like protein
MGVLLTIIAMLSISAFIFMSGGISVFTMILGIVAISVFGGVLREFVKNRKSLNDAAQKELSEINQRITKIEADIADIKEQIADFIIRQV